MIPRARWALPTLATLLLLAASACGGSSEETTTTAGPARVVIAGQSDVQTDIVNQLYKQLLEKQGFQADIKDVGARELYLDPLAKGDVQLAADYLSSTAEQLNRRQNGDDAQPVASTDIARTLAALTSLGEEAGLTPLTPSRAEDGIGFAVTEKYAAQHDVHTLSDLGRLGQPLALAAGPECTERQDCAQGLQNVYGISLSKVEPLDAGSPDTLGALRSGQVQLAQVSTTDGTLDGQGIVVLPDDKRWQNAENLLPLANTAWLKAHRGAEEPLDQLAAVLTTQDLKELNAAVTVGQKSPTEAARAYLESKDLL